MLNKVKLALRINHTLLDSDIEDTIKTARAEMIRSGCNSEIANSSHELVCQAIKTYCLYVYANDTKMQDGYFTSWMYQLENIRKSNIELPEAPEEPEAPETPEAGDQNV